MEERIAGGEGPAPLQGSPLPGASLPPAPAPALASVPVPSQAPAPAAPAAPAGSSPATSASAGGPPAPLVEGDVDTSFSPTASAALATYGRSGPADPICMWCNERLPSANAPKCPRCGALLEPVEGIPDVPGLTSVAGRPAGYRPQLVPPSTAMPSSPAAVGSVAPRSLVPSVAAGGPHQADPSAYEGLTPEEIALLADSSVALRDEISRLGSHDAYQPPSRDVRRAMLEMEFEADRADPMRIVDPGPLAERRRDEEPTF